MGSGRENNSSESVAASGFGDCIGKACCPTPLWCLGELQGLGDCSCIKDCRKHPAFPESGDFTGVDFAPARYSTQRHPTLQMVRQARSYVASASWRPQVT